MSEKKVYLGGEWLITDAEPKDVFTPEDFTQEHKMIYETSLDFVNGEVLPNLEQIDEKDLALSKTLHRKAGELGLLGTDVPEEYGGMGLDKVSTSALGDALGRSGSFSVTHNAHTGIGTLPYVYFGNEAQKQKYLPLLASGEWVGAYCLTEESAGSDALSGRARAVLSEDGKHYILNGEKMFITNAGLADVFCVYAKVDDEKFTGFIVEAGFPGVSTGAEEKKMGGHGSSTRPVILEDAQVPVENVLYEIGQGHKIAFNILNLGRWKLGAGCTGGAKHCVAESVKYANGRFQFGKPISSFGMIKNKLANMAVRTYMSECVQYRLAGMLDDKLATLDGKAKKSGQQNAKAIEEYATECSISKVFGSETLDYCVDEWVQILGGYGYCSEYPAERTYRDARINRIWEGTNEINRMLIPGTLLKRALKGRLDLFGPAQAVAEATPADVRLGDGPLALQQHLVGTCKKIALFVVGAAALKFGEKLMDEQEVLENIANISMEVFALESGLLRACKLIEKEGEDKAKHHIAAVQIYADEMVPTIEKWAKQLIAYVAEGDRLNKQVAVVAKLAQYQQLDTVTLRRQIADRIIDIEEYPFFF